MSANEAESQATELAPALTEAAAVSDETEFIAGPPPTEPASAWSEGEPDDWDADSEVIPRHRWRLTVGIAAGIVAVAAVVAAGVGFGGWGWEHRAEPDAQAAPPPKPVAEPSPKPPPMPPDAMLNGRYEMKRDSANAVYVNSSAAEWGEPNGYDDGFLLFVTHCANGTCTATSAVPEGDPSATLGWNLTWVDGVWSSDPLASAAGHGNVDTDTLVAYPDGGGHFHGIMTRLITSGPSKGAQVKMSFTLSPQA